MRMLATLMAAVFLASLPAPQQGMARTANATLGVSLTIIDACSAGTTGGRFSVSCRANTPYAVSQTIEHVPPAELPQSVAVQWEKAGGVDIVRRIVSY
jgi:hypothetical protein